MKIAKHYKSLTYILLYIISFNIYQPTLVRAEAGGTNLIAGIPIDSTETVPATEDDYYKLVTIPIPEGIKLEVGGMAVMPDGRLAVSTRRGAIWLIGNPYMEDDTSPYFKKFAHGLHEPLGLAYNDGAFYTAQRGELTRILDKDGDDYADSYEAVYYWPLTGNYHEYSYGPKILPNGDLWLTFNLGSSLSGMKSLAKWRGWSVRITPEGTLTPIAAGMRSPAGFGLNADGDMFYAENQGDWIGSGRITHIEKGDFVGHPASLAWTHLPKSPIKLKQEDIPDTGEPMHEVAKSVPGLKLPAVWFPHTLMGISTSDILVDNTHGAFGPFSDQLFVGDQGHSTIMRVFLEEVEGTYQGACFPFRKGFSSGVIRLEWGNDGSMFVGMTSRGWAASGKEPYGLQRLEWTGKMPFEIKAVYAKPDGFELEFTMPVDPKTAGNPDAYQVTGFTYKYHSTYGSPVINQKDCLVKAVKVSEDGMKARIVVDGLREGYIHKLKAEGVRSQTNAALLHDVAYYTLNKIPAGAGLSLEETATTKAHMHANATTSTTTAATQARRNITKTSAPAGANQPKNLTKMPSSWTNGPDVTINIGTKPGLKYDLTEFVVKPGSKVKLVFNNTDDMLHNLVIVDPGSWNEVAGMALNLGLDGSKMGYIPRTDKVLYHTSLLQPGASEAIYFTAPEEPDDYTYVCTFPGHASLMQGTMKVIAK